MKRILLRIGGIVLALVLLLLIANAIWIAVLKAEFEERVEALRAAGQPTEMADFRTPAIPEERNAAPLLLAAREWAEEHDNPHYSLGDPWSEEDRESVRVYLDSADEYFDLLARAATRPSCRFDYRWEDGVEMSADEVGIFQDAFRAAELRVQWSHLTNQGWDDATNALDTSVRLAEHATPRMLFCQLVRSTMLDLCCAELERIADRAEVDAGALRDRFSPLLQAAEQPERWREALIGERACALSWFRDWFDGKSPFRFEYFLQAPDFSDRTKDALLGSWFARGFAYRDALLCLDFYDEAEPLYRPGDPTATAELEAVSEATKSISCSLIDYFTLFLARSHSESVVHAARLRLARVGLALAAHHQQHGEWPATLADLGGNQPLDPYTNAPFAYERNESGITLEAQRPIDETDPEEREEKRIIWRLGQETDG